MGKPHFYRVKEDIMQISRDMDQLSVQGHSVQVFADLSPATIQKRFSLKPLTLVLSQKLVLVDFPLLSELCSE